MAKKPAKPRHKRARRNPEEARQMILEAAVRVFSKHGPDAVGLKEVAAEAGVSHALVVHYFGGYDALVEATLVEAMAKVRERMLSGVQALAHPSAEALVQIYLDAALEPWYGRLASWALMRDNQGSHAHAASIVPDMQALVHVTQQLLVGRTGNPPGRDETETLIVAVWSMAIGYIAGRDFFWRALGRTPGPERDRALRDSIAAAARTLFGEVEPIRRAKPAKAARRSR